MAGVELVLAAVAASLGAPAIAALKRFFAERKSPQRVRLKLADGKVVNLDLDAALSSDKRSQIVAGALRSVEAGDEAAVKAVVDESRAASATAREVNAAEAVGVVERHRGAK